MLKVPLILYLRYQSVLFHNKLLRTQTNLHYHFKVFDVAIFGCVKFVDDMFSFPTWEVINFWGKIL